MFQPRRASPPTASAWACGCCGHPTWTPPQACLWPSPPLCRAGSGSEGTLQGSSHPSPRSPQRWRCLTRESKPNPRQGPGRSAEAEPGRPVPPGIFRPPSHARRRAWACCLAHTAGHGLGRWAGAVAGRLAHLGHTGLQQRVPDQLPVGLVVGEQLLQAGEELALLQVETVGRRGDAVVVNGGLGPDWGTGTGEGRVSAAAHPRPSQHPDQMRRAAPRPSLGRAQAGPRSLMGKEGVWAAAS